MEVFIFAIIVVATIILYNALNVNTKKSNIQNKKVLEISLPNPESCSEIDFIKFIHNEPLDYIKAIYEQHFSNNYLKPLYRRAFEEKINNTKLVSNEFLDMLFPILKKSRTYKYNFDFELKGVHVKEIKKYILKECELYDFVILNHEPNNQFDNQAIKVQHFGKKIGYVPSHLTDNLHDIIKEDFLAYISSCYEIDGFLTVDITICYNHELPQ